MMVEYAVLAHLRSFFGWEDGDGIFAPGMILSIIQNFCSYIVVILTNEFILNDSGGSMANMYGMVLARFKKFPEVKIKGVGGIGELVAFTSQEV